MPLHTVTQIGSLVEMIGPIAEDAAVEPVLEELILALLDIYETLRQCDPDGAVSGHLGYKYDKAVKKIIKKDWQHALEHLKGKVSCHVMAMVLYDRYKQWDLMQVIHDHQGAVLRKEGSVRIRDGGEAAEGRVALTLLSQ